MHTKFILASSSSSRYKILKDSGFSFIKISPEIDEEKIKKQIRKKIKPSFIAKKLSYEKAKSINLKKKYFNHTVIGCDTLIYIGDKIFDKAKNISEAKKKLTNLSGRKHNIVSGVTIFRQGKKIYQFSETSQVKIRKLNKNKINNYLTKTGEQILSSVGCYQAEALGPIIIEDIKGDFFNVMGLPLFKLLKYVSKNK
ncbi:Maf family nucleotide pyrophosphatase [Pelagibacteraceae bacterium]|nr:Maf family nucleotide pyrophosphatase [Pelagibacteraceae bacterium]